MAFKDIEEIDDIFRILENLDILGKLISCLTPRQKKVINWLYGLDTAPLLTLQEISDKMKISTESIRLIEAKAIGKMRLAAIKKGIKRP